MLAKSFLAFAIFFFYVTDIKFLSSNLASLHHIIRVKHQSLAAVLKLTTFNINN
jgi:hypothetical protein